MKKNIMKKESFSKTVPVVLGALLLSNSLWANDVLNKQKETESYFESVLARKGIEVHGEIKGEWAEHSIDKEAQSVDKTKENTEKKQYARFDLDFRFRPYEISSFRTILRFHQDAQTYFADRNRPVLTRWVSIDGKNGEWFSYNVGDFKQKYSPLTLWSPEVSFLNEAKVFSREREEAMAENFLSDNERVLRGININLAPQFSNKTSEIRAEAFASRLTRPEYLDAAGYLGGLNSPFGGSLDADSNYVVASGVDQYATGLNTDLILNSGILLGATGLYQWADAGSFVPQWSDSSLSKPTAYKTTNFAGRFGLDVGALAKSKTLVFDFLAEAALSQRQTVDLAKQSDIGDKSNGFASLNELNLGYQTDEISFVLGSRYIQNDKTFYNPLAQSQSFIGERVMNIDNDAGNGVLGSRSDALYNSYFHYTPSGVNKNAQVSPYEKNSYTNSIAENACAAEDLAVYGIFSCGYATPNRVGVDLDLTFAWAKNLEIKGVFTKAKQETKDEANKDKAEYDKIGGALKLDIADFVGVKYPIETTVSYTTTKKAYSVINNKASELKANVLNVGSYYALSKKFAILAGYQMFEDINNVSEYKSKVTLKEHHLRGGLEFHIGDDVYIQWVSGLVDVREKNTNTESNVEIQTRQFTGFVNQLKLTAGF